MSINGVQQSRDDITRMIKAIRDVSNKQTIAMPEVKKTDQAEFSSVLSQAVDSINDVNKLQQTAKSLKTAYAAGDKNVSLAETVLASQKSSLAFQALLNVRNKMINAYKDIMNMPI